MIRFADSTYYGVPILRDEIMCDDYCVKKKTDGMFELQFSISIYNPAYKHLREESKIYEDYFGTEQRYIVKAIDAGEKKVTVKCKYDLDEWRGNVYWGFAMQDTFANVVNHVLPTGWTLVNSTGDVTTQLVELEACTRLDVVVCCEELWPNLTAIFDNATKTVTLLNKNNGTNHGAMVSRDLNMKKLTYKGKSTDFATRLFPMGKDGLKITSVNQGIEYIEDTTYSSNIVCAYMIDSSIDDATQLLNAAREVLADICVPSRSYSCDIVDLQAALPLDYSWLQIDLFDKVTIIDDTKYDSIYTYTVVEKWIYPYLPNKNKIVLSKSAPKIQNQVHTVTAKVAEDDATMQQQISDISAAQIGAMLGFSDGKVRLVDTDADGKIDTIFIADNVTPANAVNVVKINQSGISKSSNGYSGYFAPCIDWANGCKIVGQNLNYYYNGDEYVPTQITYTDGNGITQIVTVLAQAGFVPDEPLIEEPLLEEP